MFNIEFAKSFLRDFKKIPKEVQDTVLNKWIPKLQEDPHIGKLFKGQRLNGFSRLAFRYKKNDYRIVYQIHQKKVIIVLLAIGSRENFYKRLNKRF